MKLSAGARQTLVAVIVNIVSFNVGLAIGWTSPNNPKLRDVQMRDTPLDSVPSSKQMSWIGPLVPLGAAISPYLAAPLTIKLGQKKVIFIAAVFYTASYLILGFGKKLVLIYVARVLQGFGVGFNMFVIPIYVGEISQDLHRGALETLLVLFFVTGILITFLIGPFVSYVAFQFICIIFPVLFFILFVFIPESPFFTLMKGNTEQTKKTLKFLRGTSDDEISKEMDEIKELLDLGAEHVALWTDLFTVKGHFKALIICTGLMFVQQFSGINAVVMYAQTIFDKAGGSMKSEISSIIIAVTQVVATYCTTLVIDRFGRKLILIISNVGMIISMGLLGLYFFMDSAKMEIAKSVAFLPITSLIIYIIMFSIGFGPIPWALIGEMFPSEIKNTSAMLVSSACWTFAFIITKFYDAIEDAIGTHWVFWGFTFFLILGLIFTCLYVIETKGLTLQHIQDKLNGRI